MEKRQRGLILVLLEVGVEFLQRGGQQQRLVNNGPVREGGDVEVCQLLLAGLDGQLAAHEVELALEFVVPHFLGTLQEELLDQRHGAARLFTQLVGIDRHVPPAERLDAAVAQDALGEQVDAHDLHRLVREEENANGEVHRMIQGMAEFFHLGQQHVIGNLGEHT